jgi:hypothetical protein
LKARNRSNEIIIDTYLAPDKTFFELREMIDSWSITCFAISAWLAAQNLNRFALNNSER